MEFLIFPIALLFVLGLAIGSFLNVVIYRTVHGESFVKGRSHCPHCMKKISWYDNIPLLSFLLLHGHCRHCKKTISWAYPTVEFITGTLFVWWFFLSVFVFRLSQAPFHFLQPVFWLTVGVLLVFVFFADVLYGIIPDGAVIALTGAAFAYRTALAVSGVMRPQDYAMSVASAFGACFLFYVLWELTKRKGIGFGDVKFAFPLGLLLGWPNILVGLFLSFVFGAVFGIASLVLKKKKFGQTLPFGPFLVIGTVVTLMFGNRLVQWYLTLL